MTPEEARALGQRSGQARRRLTLEDVERELGRLETPADAQRWARIAFQWGSAGLIPKGVVTGCASLMREWRELFKLQVQLAGMVKLQRRIDELERELAKRGPPA